MTESTVWGRGKGLEKQALPFIENKSAHAELEHYNITETTGGREGKPARSSTCSEFYSIHTEFYSADSAKLGPGFPPPRVKCK